MSSYFNTIVEKANNILNNTVDVVKDYVLDHPTTASLIAGSSVVGSFLFTRTSLYQRHATVIRSIAVLSAIGVGYAGYNKIKPLLHHLYKAKQMLENSNQNRMILTPEQLHVIDTTNIQSWVVTLDALRTTSLDTYNVGLILQAVDKIRQKQRMMNIETHTHIYPLFNHYRIAVYSQTISTLVATAIVRYFNAISVGVTYRYSEVDRQMIRVLSLTPEQQIFVNNYEEKCKQIKLEEEFKLQQAASVSTLPQDTIELTTAKPVTISLQDKQQYELLISTLNNDVQSKTLSDVLHGAVTDVLNLIYQSTLTVLFPVLSQIVATHIMNTDVPLSYSQNPKLRYKKNNNNNKDKMMFDVETWVSTMINTPDIMLLLERATIKTFLTLLQPTEWFVEYEFQNNITNTNASSTTTSAVHPSTTTTTTPTTIPISDYLLGFGYGDLSNCILHDPKSNTSSTDYCLLSSHEITDLKLYALESLEQNSHDDPIVQQQIKAKYPHLVEFKYKDPQTIPIIRPIKPTKKVIHPINFHQQLDDNTKNNNKKDNNTSNTDDIQPLPLLAHLLLPVGPLLHSLLTRLDQFDTTALKVTPSALGMMPAEAMRNNSQAMQLFTNNNNTASAGQNPLSAAMSFTPGVTSSGSTNNGNGGGIFANTTNYFNNLNQDNADVLLQQQKQTLSSTASDPSKDNAMILDIKEVYTRRVLQVVGELHSIMLCPDIKLGYEEEFQKLSQKQQQKQQNNNKIDITSNQVDNMDISLHQWHYIPKEQQQHVVNDHDDLIRLDDQIQQENNNNNLENKDDLIIAETNKIKIFTQDELEQIQHPKALPHLYETITTAGFTVVSSNDDENKNLANAGDQFDDFFADGDNNNDPNKIKNNDDQEFDYTFDKDGLIYTLEHHIEQYAIFSEMWKDTKVLLHHVGGLLYESNKNNNMNKKLSTTTTSSQVALPINNNNTNNDNSNTQPEHKEQRLSQQPTEQTPAAEPLSNMLVVTKRLSQIFNTLLPSLQTAKDYQRQRMMGSGASSAANNNPQQQQHLLTPHSYAFSLTMYHTHRKYVVDNLMKAIAARIGREKIAGGANSPDATAGAGDGLLEMLGGLAVGGGAGGNGDSMMGGGLLESLLGGGGSSGGGNEEEMLKQLMASMSGSGSGVPGGNGGEMDVLQALLGGGGGIPGGNMPTTTQQQSTTTTRPKTTTASNNNNPSALFSPEEQELMKMLGANPGMSNMPLSSQQQQQPGMMMGSGGGGGDDELMRLMALLSGGGGAKTGKAKKGTTTKKKTTTSTTTGTKKAAAAATSATPKVKEKTNDITTTTTNNDNVTTLISNVDVEPAQAAPVVEQQQQQQNTDNVD